METVGAKGDDEEDEEGDDDGDDDAVALVGGEGAPGFGRGDEDDFCAIDCVGVAWSR